MGNRIFRGKALALALLMLCSLLMLACAPAPAAPTALARASLSAGEEHAVAEATIMVYIVGSDLESKGGNASYDLMEMMNSGFDFTNKNLVVMTGGASSWMRSSRIPADELTVYEVSAKKITPVSSSPLASMADPETLTAFLDFCCTYYPAESYGLILWNHGGGPMGGYGMDENFNDMLSVPEIAEALEQSPFGRNSKLAFLGFDACLMSSAEVAWSLQDYADYMIASEEVIPGNGWDYSFLAQLPAGTLDGAEVGRLVVDSYGAYYEDALAGSAMLKQLTLACLDLSCANELEDAVDGLFSVLEEDLDAGLYMEIARSREDTLLFAKLTTGSDYDLIDLGDLAEQVSESHPAEAAAVEDALDKMVVYQWTPLARAHGLTLYYPYDNKVYYSYEWGEFYPELGFAPDYANFMDSFAEEWLNGSSANWRGMNLLPLEQDEETSEYYVQLTEEQAEDYLEGRYYLVRKLLGGEYLLCGMRRDVELDEQNRLYARFDGNTVFVQNSEGDRFTPMYYDYSNLGYPDFHISATLFTMPVEPEDEFVMEMAWFLATLESEGAPTPMLTAIEDVRGEEDQLVFGKNEFQITDFESIYFPVYVCKEKPSKDGKALPVNKWDIEVSGSLAGYLTTLGWEAELAPLGDDGYEYYLQLVATDVYGEEYASELIPVPMSEAGQAKHDQMFLGQFPPLPENPDPIPELPTLESAIGLHDDYDTEFGEREVLLVDDPSGVRITLMRSYEGESYYYYLVRVDDESPYFDRLSLGNAFYGYEGTGVFCGDTRLDVAFSLNMQKGASYYEEIAVKKEEVPAGAKELTVIFRLMPSEFDTPVMQAYNPEPATLPLP